MADPTDKPGYAFGSAPPRAVRDFLAGKSPVRTRGFRDLEPQEHAVAFTVAQSAKFDILTDVQAALQKALDEGQTFETFRKGLAPTLAAQGWWGRKVVDGREVQLGSPRRLRTIYRANMRAARAAGQWERIERVRDALPYLLYQLGPSERDRPHHAAKDGWVLPVDDPFWNEWMPPNGWGCKCHVRQITAQEAGRRGIVREVNIPRRTVRDPVTLKPRDLPAGLDPAWSSNPGKDRLRNAEAFLEGRLAALARRPGPDASPRARALADELGPAMTRAAARDVALSWRVQRLPEGPKTARAPVAMAPAPIAENLGAGSRVVSLSGASAAKVIGKHGVTGEDLARLTGLLEQGPLFRLPADDRNPERYVALDVADRPKDRPMIFVVKAANEGDGLFVTSIHPASTNGQVWKFFEKGSLARDTAAFKLWRAQHPNRRQ